MTIQRIQAVVEVEAHDDHVIRIMVTSLLERMLQSPRIDGAELTDKFEVFTTPHSVMLTFAIELYASIEPKALAIKLLEMICQQVTAEQGVTAKVVPQCLHLLQAIAA
jgi:coenzyme F420-reducing hydrogenase beta subunit